MLESWFNPVVGGLSADSKRVALLYKTWKRGCTWNVHYIIFQYLLKDADVLRFKFPNSEGDHYDFC